MGDADQLSLQRWLPGLEPGSGVLAAGRPVRRPRGTPKPPTVDKLLAKASDRVRKVFQALRGELLGAAGLSERVRYDETTGGFLPCYGAGDHDVVRLHLDPVLAATVTLERDRQLAALIHSPALSDRLKAQLMKGARRSGRRVFLGLPVRNPEEAANLVTVLRERLSGEG